MGLRSQTMLWIAQRASAALLAFCVFVHLGVIIYAVRGGISAAEILGRTQGNASWLAFYSLFVLACAVHAPIGLRTVLNEWGGWRGRGCDTAMWLFAALLAWAGMRAVIAVTG